jgi:hypothetical protein
MRIPGRHSRCGQRPANYFSANDSASYEKRNGVLSIQPQWRGGMAAGGRRGSQNVHQHQLLKYRPNENDMA